MLNRSTRANSAQTVANAATDFFAIVTFSIKENGKNKRYTHKTHHHFPVGDAILTCAKTRPNCIIDLETIKVETYGNKPDYISDSDRWESQGIRKHYIEYGVEWIQAERGTGIKENSHRWDWECDFDNKNCETTREKITFDGIYSYIPYMHRTLIWKRAFCPEEAVENACLCRCEVYYNEWEYVDYDICDTCSVEQDRPYVKAGSIIVKPWDDKETAA